MTATPSRLRTAIVLAVVAMLGMAILDSVRAQSPLEEAKALNARAMELYQAGKFSEAIPLVHRALAIREKALGPDHPRSAPSRCTGEAMMNTSDDAKRKLLEALETALLRSPFYDEKSRAEAMRDLQDAIGGPPFDDVAKFMSPERAEFVRKRRVDEKFTFRAVAAACAKEWGANWGSNQLIGEDLCRAAAETLGIPLEKFFYLDS